MSESSEETGGSSQEAIAAWEDVRADSSIQFEIPPEEDPPEPPPQWWVDFREWLSELLAPVGEFLVANWPILKIMLLGALAIGVALLIWYIARNMIAERRKLDGDVEEDAGWRPDIGTARALLQDADALAAEGRFAEAIRLILWRSIEDISKAEPRAITPANTAREIGRFTILSDHAREVFTMIAGHVERGIFAAQPVEEGAWQEARSAYDDFAMADGRSPRRSRRTA
ncbi:MAG: hypothetical protein AAGH53_03170 [Pseudomonadota bacterium]